MAERPRRRPPAVQGLLDLRFDGGRQYRPVTDALREDAGEAIALVTPAFPETARTVYLGHLFVGAVPLAESPLKDHPLNPMRDSNLVRVLARQSRAGVGLIDLATVAQGAEAVGPASMRWPATARVRRSPTLCSTATSRCWAPRR